MRQGSLRQAYQTAARASKRRKLVHDSASLQELNAQINAFTFIAPPSSPPPGPLNHLKIAIKDAFCTKSMPTTCASKMLSTFQPPYNATVVQSLIDAGAQIIGKTNMDEFGMGSTNTNSNFGPAINPHSLRRDQKHVTGGSSGGSAAAVASGACDAALGSDTGGSTRLPAAYCGVVGFKPSYGICSRYGLIAYASSLDCVGIMGKDVSTTQTVFTTINSYDWNDPTAIPPNTRSKATTHFATLSETPLSSLKIGIPIEFFPAELSSKAYTPLRQTIQTLLSTGASITPISLPSTKYALSCYYVLASSEASSNLSKYNGVRYGYRDERDMRIEEVEETPFSRTRSDGFGMEVRKRILLGTYALAAEAFDNYFLKAQNVRRMIKEDYDGVFRHSNILSGSSGRESGVDFLLHPGAISTAPTLAETQSGSSLQGYVQDILNVPASLAGLPALALPTPVLEEELPLSVQLVGQWGSDEALLEFAKRLEGVLGN